MCLAGHGQRQDIYLSGKHNLTLMQRDVAFLLQNLCTKGDDIEENLVDPKSRNIALALIRPSRGHACFKNCLQ